MNGIINNLLILYFFLSASFSACQTGRPDPDPIESLKQDIYVLAADSLEGREVGTVAEKTAARYLSERFEVVGLEPRGEEGYFQEFIFTPRMNPHVQSDPDDSTGLTAHNVIGYIDNKMPSTVVIGAHYDHLGYGGSGSLHRGDAMIHNGADDNASGVAAMILLAQRLKARITTNNYLFIAFSGEEKGLLGSNYYVKNPTIDLSAVNYMINLDMVGRLDEEKTLAINGVGTSPDWLDEIESITMDSLKVVTNESGVGPSDHTSFYLQDIPVLHFFTGTHDDYHKPSDDADKINYDGLFSVVTYIDSLILKLEDDPKLAFTNTKDDLGDTPRFTVTLGVVPDYLFDGEGMRIDGVSEDRPAHRAGLEAGDIVIGLGDQEVKGMRSYMEALSKFEKGDKTTVTVRRKTGKLTKDIQF